MKSKYRAYLMTLSMLFINSSLLCMSADDNIKKFSNMIKIFIEDNHLENTNPNFEGIYQIKAEIIKYMNEKKMGLPQIKQVINDIFFLPTKEAIINKKYQFAYRFISESQLDKNLIEGIETLAPNEKKILGENQLNLCSLTSEPHDSRSLLKYIIDSNSPLLLMQAKSWIASTLLLHLKLQEFRNDTSKIKDQIFKDGIKREVDTFIANLKNAGLEQDKIKYIALELFIRIKADPNPLSQQSIIDFIEKVLPLKDNTWLGPDINFAPTEKKLLATYALMRQTRLFSSKNAEIMQDLISKKIKEGADINGRDIISQDTILIAALRHSPARKAKKFVVDLLNSNVDINKAGKNQKTPLMYACLIPDTSIIERLLSKGARVNEHDIYGSTALEDTITSSIYSPKKEEIIRILIKAGADVTIENIFGETVFDVLDEPETELLNSIIQDVENKKISLSLPEQLGFFSQLTHKLHSLSNCANNILIS